MRIATLISLLLFSAVSHAEVWKCKRGHFWDPFVKDVVTAVSREGFMKSEIHVAGTKHLATFRVNGFDRRWNFGFKEEDRSYNYALVIEPNGAAHYYDFRGTEVGESAEESQVYFCLKTT